MNAIGNNGRYFASATNTGVSMMNRVRSFFGRSKNALVSTAANIAPSLNGNGSGVSRRMWISGVFGVILIFFLALVLYNDTIGTYVSDGFNRLKKLIQGDTDIKVEIDPGLTGTPAVSVDVTKQEPEPTPEPAPETGMAGSLLPEPVTVPTIHDTPPQDSIPVPAEDRPAGMPGALSLGSASLSDSGSTSDSSSGLPTALSGSEVFNIGQNIYTFNDAAAVCAAADAELATYEQVKAAYDKGADWCNYGWIKGQMAVYPTQKSTYEKLQKGAPEWRNACGVPGVNGGYFDNPELRFGVNCYGVKPAQKASDEILDSQVALPQTPAEIEFEKHVQRFRDQMDTVSVLPFTKGQWNE